MGTFIDLIIKHKEAYDEKINAETEEIVILGHYVVSLKSE